MFASTSTGALGLQLTNAVGNNLTFDESQAAKMRISDRGIAEFKVKLNGRKKYIEFDSGSGDFFSYKSKDAEKIQSKNKTEVLSYSGAFSYGVSSQNNLQATKRFRPKVECLKIGEVTIKDFYSDFSKKSAPRFGASMLYHGKLTLDFTDSKFYYELYNEELVLPEYETFGFDIGFIRDQYVIKWILDGSPADQKGLKYGRIVHSINGIPIEQIQEACDSYINGFTFENDSSVSITVHGENNELNTVSISRLKK